MAHSPSSENNHSFSVETSSLGESFNLYAHSPSKPPPSVSQENHSIPPLILRSDPVQNQYTPKFISHDLEMVANPIFDILGRMDLIKITNKRTEVNFGYSLTRFDVEQYSQVGYRHSTMQDRTMQDRTMQDARETAEFRQAVLPPPPEFKKLWCKFEVSITTGPFHEVDLKYVDGDKLSFRIICWDLQRGMQTEVLLLSRIQYLRLIDGCPEARGHIPAYLFNELVSREVCEFIGANEIMLLNNITHRHITLRVYL